MLGYSIFLLIYSVIGLFIRVFWNFRIVDRENLPPRDKHGVLVAVNHLDWSDTYIVGGSLPLAYRPIWFAKKEVFKNRFVTWFLGAMNVIPLDRGEADRHAYLAAKRALEKGAAMVLFPEGHRSPNHALIEGKHGAIRLAVRTGVPIVPMAIWGTEVGFLGALLRKPIRVRYGKPYNPSALTSGAHDQWEKLTDDLMRRIAALLPEEYRGIYGSQTETISHPSNSSIKSYGGAGARSV